LNHPVPKTSPDIPPAETELLVNFDKPSKREIRKAIAKLKNSKAAGPDNITAEAMKADTELAVTILTILYNLFSKIWEKEEVPAQWKEGLVIKLLRKETLGTAATNEASWSCLYRVRFSTGFFWRE
jgi:hypothetical protein